MPPKVFHLTSITAILLSSSSAVSFIRLSSPPQPASNTAQPASAAVAQDAASTLRGTWVPKICMVMLRRKFLGRMGLS
ncbi:hypothetical protein S83_030665 [Arachis hypogaea]